MRAKCRLLARRRRVVECALSSHGVLSSTALYHGPLVGPRPRVYRLWVQHGAQLAFKISHECAMRRRRGQIIEFVGVLTQVKKLRWGTHVVDACSGVGAA